MPNLYVFFFQAEDGIRDSSVTGVQTCALPISPGAPSVPAPVRVSFAPALLQGSAGRGLAAPVSTGVASFAVSGYAPQAVRRSNPAPLPTLPRQANGTTLSAPPPQPRFPPLH